MKRDDLIALVADAPRGERLALLLKVLPTPSKVIAQRAGCSTRTLSSGRLSLPLKLRVARVVRVPAAIIWPELQTLAWELLYGFKER